MQSAAQLPEAFVVLGFAFYLQPMMMPLLHDMPPGPSGLAITSTAVKIVIIGGLVTVQLVLHACIWVQVHAWEGTAIGLAVVCHHKAVKL